MILDILPLTALLIASPDGRRRGRRQTRRHKAPDPDGGKWIWAAECGEPNSYIYARKVFRLENTPSLATIKAAADSGYRLYVNGEYVGEGAVRGGGGEVAYDTFDITARLAKGDNVVAVLGHFLGENTYNYCVGRPGLICKVEIEMEPGSRVIGTDETWKVHRAEDWTRQGVRISKGLGFQEVYDSGRRLDNWTEVKFGERDWQPARVLGMPGEGGWPVLVPREVPTLREETAMPIEVVGVFNSPARDSGIPAADVPEAMAAFELSAIRNGRVQHAEALLAASGQTVIQTPRGDGGIAIILDFGQMLSGCVEVAVAGSGEGVIDLGYGEALEEGRVKPNKGELFYTDRILLKKGRFAWRGFSPRGFRYLQMEFRRCQRPLTLDSVCAYSRQYPVELASGFECSDPQINRIWRAGASTALLCMQDVLVDSPRVERAQWWGDARIISRVAYYAFADISLLAQGLRQFARAQHKDGAIVGLAPSGIDKMVPDFALAWVFSILDYFAFSSNADLVRELYPNLTGLMKWFGRHRDQDGLLANVPGEPFIDWAETENQGNVTSLNCLYHEALRVSSVLASIVGHDDDAEEALAVANALRIAINKHLFDPGHGLYGSARVQGRLDGKFDPQTNVLAAVCDVADQYQKSAILRWVLRLPPHEIATPYFASFLLEALYSSDRHEEALHYIKNRWGPMASGDNATLWEDFEGGVGRCQGWATSPTRDLLAEYVGIKPSMVPDRFSVTPHTGGLTWVQGFITTTSGRLSVSWRRTRNQFGIRVEVPKNLRVDVYPPWSHQARITLDGRPNPGRLLSLGAGAHQIKVVEPPVSRSSKDSEKEKPVVTPQVEVLGPVYRPAHRSGGTSVSRRRAKAPSSQEMAAERPVNKVDAFVDDRPDAVAQNEETAAQPKAPRPSGSRRGPGSGRRGARRKKPQETGGQEPGDQTETPTAEPDTTQ